MGIESFLMDEEEERDKEPKKESILETIDKLIKRISKLEDEIRELKSQLKR